jgi:hypothetical protein
VVAALQPDTSSREIGRLAVWSVTSAKPGNGVELLRDGREDTYWQSDGAQPHLVNVQFQKKVGVLASQACWLQVPVLANGLAGKALLGIGARHCCWVAGRHGSGAPGASPLPPPTIHR